MADSDVEEITIVLKDGTIERWTGETATRISGYIHGLMAIAGGVKLAHPTVTRPLRRVTEIEGRYSSLNNEIIEDDSRALFAVTLRDLMPTSLTPRRAKIRVTVEAVEEKG